MLIPVPNYRLLKETRTHKNKRKLYPSTKRRNQKIAANQARKE
jgi:hypothetical protein